MYWIIRHSSKTPYEVMEFKNLDKINIHAWSCLYIERLSHWEGNSQNEWIHQQVP